MLALRRLATPNVVRHVVRGAVPLPSGNFVHQELLRLILLLITVFFIFSAPIQAATPAPLPAPSAVYGNSPRLEPGAITVHPYAGMRESGTLDDYDTQPIVAISDPLEPWNRFWFGFNDIFFLYVAKPMYTGYSAVMPRQFRSGIKNFFSNLLFPVRFANNLLQFRFKEAGVEFGRFVINTTAGLGGFVDAAKGKKTIVEVDPGGEDFGQTLGRWGIGQGFYLVLPFYGPSSARDAVGRVGDIFADPLFYVKPWELSTGASGFLRFNALSDVLPLYEELNSAAIDPYIAMREAYANFRNAAVKR